jgi:ABC-2 type transport system permease protein
MITDVLRQLLVVASYEVRKYFRGRRLLGMLVLLAIIVGLILGVPPALGVPYASEPNEFVSTFASFSGLLVVLGGVLFAADALVSEHEKRTGYFLFPNPVRREVLVLGKLVASLLTSGLIISVYYLAATLAALAVTGATTWEVGLSYAYALAYAVAVVGVAYLVSAVLKSTVAATVLTFFLFTLIFGIVGALLMLGRVDPWFVPTSAAGIIGNVLSPAPPGGPGGGFGSFVPDPATSLAVFAAYFVTGSVLAILLFRRRELSG